MLPYGSANSAAEYWRHSQVPRKAVAGSFLPCSYLTERKAWMTKGQGCKEINSRDSMKKIFGELCRNAIIQPQRMCKNEHIQPSLSYQGEIHIILCPFKSCHIFLLQHITSAHLHGAHLVLAS